MRGHEGPGDDAREGQSMPDQAEAQAPAGEASPCRGRRNWWKIAIVVALGIVIAAISLEKRRSRGPTGVPSGEPGDSEPAAAKDQQHPPQTVLATVNGEEVTLEQLQRALEELPPRQRSACENSKHDLLESLVIRRLLLQEAERLNVGQTDAYRQALAAMGQGPGAEERALIDALLQEKVLSGLDITESRLRGYYEELKDEMPGSPSFEQARDLVRSSALQQEQYRAFQNYVAELREKADVALNDEWIEAQKAAATDNPLDRALSTGRPVLADFGRGVCIPCKMMAPILEALKKEYEGRAEIVFIEIDQYPAVTRRCGIRAMPTQIFYDSNGNEVYRHQGFMPRDAIVEQLAKLGVR